MNIISLQIKRLTIPARGGMSKSNYPGTVCGIILPNMTHEREPLDDTVARHLAQRFNNQLESIFPSTERSEAIIESIPDASKPKGHTSVGLDRVDHGNHLFTSSLSEKEIKLLEESAPSHRLRVYDFGQYAYYFFFDQDGNYAKLSFYKASDELTKQEMTPEDFEAVGQILHFLESPRLQ